MLKIFTRYVLLFACCCFQLSAFSQDRTVSGTVTDDSGDGLPAANVLIKGTTTGTVTDLAGEFNIQVPPDATLVISSVGYTTQEVEVGSQSTINVSMATDVLALSEVVVVGYGEQKKVTVTGAVVAVEGKKLIESPAVELTNSLSGRLPGLVVIQDSGEPGNDGAEITIRGTNTLGNSSPLIVIDGIPDRDGGLGRLSGHDIASISVLKDASAAIYGARAANGVLLVTTKRGEVGKPKITYEFNQGWAQPTIVPNMSNAPEYAGIMNELPIYNSIPVGEWEAAWNSIKTTGSYSSPTPGVETLNANFSPDAVQKHADGSDPWGFPDTDWFGDAFRDWTPQSRHSLQISGGTEATRVFASLGYINQDAIYKNSSNNYKQYNLRINADTKINDYVSAKLGLMIRREDRQFSTEGVGSIFRMLMRGRPTEPEVWPNGLPGPDIENGQNPVVITTNATGYDRRPADYIQTTGSVDITNPWIDGLKLTFLGSVDYNNTRQKRWETPWELYFWDRTSFEPDGVTPLLEGAVRSNFTDPRLTQGSATILNTNLTGMLSYDRTIGVDHNINILAGVTREKFTGEFFQAFRRNFISPAIDQLSVGGATQSAEGLAFERPRLGYYGRFQYNYKEKYLAEFIWRRDGSYIFPEADRFGFFPGMLVGWNISNEDFFNVDFVDYLKIRASYGQMGNDQVFFNGALQEYAFLSTYRFTEYPINSVVEKGLQEAVLANNNFTWERANNFNIGVDGTILGGKVDFTLEYFYNKRDQILIQRLGSTPASAGIGDLLPPENIGKVDNKGFEYNIGYFGNLTPDLRFEIGANGGYAKNEIVFMDEIPGAPSYQLQEGKPIGAHLVFESEGAFLNEEEIASNSVDYSGVTSQLKPGDMRFKDINGDNKIDADDRVRLEEGVTPTFFFGSTMRLEYKNFDLSVLFQGATGASIRIQTESGDIGNFLKYSHDNRWSIDNPSSEHPRLASRGDTYYTGGNFGNNTYFLFNKNYIRLKNVQLAYTLPSTLLDQIGISNVRIYVNALNLATWSKNDIFDPESTVSNGVYYPQSRVINTGLSVTF